MVAAKGDKSNDNIEPNNGLTIISKSIPVSTMPTHKFVIDYLIGKACVLLPKHKTPKHFTVFVPLSFYYVGIIKISKSIAFVSTAVMK